MGQRRCDLGAPRVGAVCEGEGVRSATLGKAGTSGVDENRATVAEKGHRISFLH